MKNKYPISKPVEKNGAEPHLKEVKKNFYNLLK